MEFRRRQYLTTPGESLLLPMQAMNIAERLSQWTKYTNLPSASIFSSPLVSAPLVRRTPDTRWPADTNPTLFWHPLMWLPARLSEPDSDDTVDMFAVRVALELTVTGLYDVESGTWLDVLSTVGLDIDDEIVQARITDWLNGEPDTELDSIDLSSGLDDPEDIEWSRDQAEELLPLLVPASWAVLSNDLISMASEALSYEEFESEDLALDARTIIYLAQGSIGDGPTTDDEPESAADLWQRILDDLPNWPHRTPDEIIDGPFDALVESLYTIRNDYWVFVEALWEGSAAGAPDSAPAS